jgi:hypothetical protein
MIEREYFNGPIKFVCDECGERDETHCESFGGALAKFRSHGGVVAKAKPVTGTIQDDWEHFCGECVE